MPRTIAEVRAAEAGKQQIYIDVTGAASTSIELPTASLATYEEFTRALFHTILPALGDQPAAMHEWISLAQIVQALNAEPVLGWSGARSYMEIVLHRASAGIGSIGAYQDEVADQQRVALRSTQYGHTARGGGATLARRHLAYLRIHLPVRSRRPMSGRLRSSLGPEPGELVGGERRGGGALASSSLSSLRLVKMPRG